MKKIISLVLSLTLIMGMSITAFAANGIVSGGTDSADVKGTYKGMDSSVVYSVDIAWFDLEFTYNGAYKGEWNPATHSYDNASEAGWAEGQGTITITNHSNTGIIAVPTYKAGDGFESASMDFSTDSLAVNTADNGVGGAAGSAVIGNITVTPEGTLPEGTSGEVIGTITITIS